MKTYYYKKKEEVKISFLFNLMNINGEASDDTFSDGLSTSELKDLSGNSTIILTDTTVEITTGSLLLNGNPITGGGGGGVSNPMDANLDADGFNITDVGFIQAFRYKDSTGATSIDMGTTSISTNVPLVISGDADQITTASTTTLNDKHEFRKAGGCQNGDSIYQDEISAYDDTDTVNNVASVRYTAGEDHTTTERGTNISLWNTNNGSITSSERLSINADRTANLTGNLNLAITELNVLTYPAWNGTTIGAVIEYGFKFTTTVDKRIYRVGILEESWTAAMDTNPRNFRIWTEGVSAVGAELFLVPVPRTTVVDAAFITEVDWFLPAGTYRTAVTTLPGQARNSTSAATNIDFSQITNVAACNTGNNQGARYPASVSGTANSSYQSLLWFREIGDSNLIIGNSTISDISKSDTVQFSNNINVLGDASVVGLNATSINSLTPVGGLYSGLSDGALISGGTIGSLLPASGIGSLSVPANGFSVGDAFHLVCAGDIPNGDKDDIITITLNPGAVQLAQLSVDMEDNDPDVFFELEADFCVRSIGATGSIITSFDYTFNKRLLKDFKGSRKVQLSTIDTTSVNTLTLTAQFAGQLNSECQTRLFYLSKQY